jgi:hypothetical protein
MSATDSMGAMEVVEVLAILGTLLIAGAVGYVRTVWQCARDTQS